MIGLVLALGLAAAAYLLGARRARPWPAARTAAFLAGLAAFAVALLSGLDAAADDRLSAHMVQHLLLTLVAPPLLLLGAPVLLALRALPRAPRRALAAAVTGPVGRTLSRPAVALAVFAAVMLGVHVPALYDAALRTPALHVAEHLLFVTAALVLWIPVLAVPPLPHASSPVVRILVVLAAMPPMIAIGVALSSSRSLVYGAYAGPGALADQHAAGMVMWVAGSVGMAAIALAAGWLAILREERRAVRREASA